MIDNIQIIYQLNLKFYKMEDLNMSRDFWGFNNIKDLKKETQNMPDSILKEQISLLGEKTNFILYGKCNFVKIRSDEIPYKVATIFNIVVPALDNYEKTILIMYSNPEEEYPVEITVGSSFEDDCDFFTPKYKCDDIDTFTNVISEILQSKEILHLISVLYAKASITDIN